MVAEAEKRVANAGQHGEWQLGRLQRVLEIKAQLKAKEHEQMAGILARCRETKDSDIAKLLAQTEEQMSKLERGANLNLPKPSASAAARSSTTGGRGDGVASLAPSAGDTRRDTGRAAAAATAVARAAAAMEERRSSRLRTQFCQCSQPLSSIHLRCSYYLRTCPRCSSSSPGWHSP